MLGQYSNGWGHALVTVAVLAMCSVLKAINAIDTSTFALIVGPVISFWFMSGAVNRFGGGSNAGSTQSGSSNTTNSSNNNGSTFQSRS